ncbi:MAG: BMP family ABC transporter substrate-binding protein [Clostridia bacterium]|nr:BMP family ABC transporter substrate-binding protein [Clostridia bacterium]
MKEKAKIIATLVVCVVVLAAVSVLSGFWKRQQKEANLKVGIICSEDESTPYTYNFLKGKYALEEEYGKNVEIFVRSNVHGNRAEESMRELIRKGVSLIFVNADTEAAVNLAPEFPKVQFCQISMPDISPEGKPDNYHTFNGEIYQARYVSGVVAGLKMREMIDSGAVLPENAVIGYVAANKSAEVISGYTAFLLGVRSVAPETVMRVRYTGSWSNFPKEKETARTLIDEGCLILSHHTNTMAPAIACEEASQTGRRVYFIGYHQSMMDVAPSCALVSVRSNWVPYILQATDAVMHNERIESIVKGNVHGNDISAGFGENWVEMVELNKLAMGQGTEEKMNRVIENMKKGKTKVFQGQYTGVNPDRPEDTVDLGKGFEECSKYSSPAFRYVLKNVIIEDN